MASNMNYYDTSKVGGDPFAGGVDWMELGSQIQDQSLKTMSFFTNLMNQEWEKKQRSKELAESRRRFDITSQQTNRSQNLSALDYLSGKMQKKPMSYNDAIAKAVRSY